MDPFSHVIVSDLDGTLLDGTHHINPVTSETLNQIMAKYNKNGVESVILVLASGRNLKDVSAILGELKLPTDTLTYIVSSNGAQVHRCIFEKNGAYRVELFRETCLSPDHVKELIQWVPYKDEEVNINLYQGEGWRSVLDWQDQLEYFKTSGLVYDLFDPEAEVKAYEKFLAGERGCPNPFEKVYKLFYGSDNVERISQIGKEIVAKYGDSLSVTSSGPYNLEIMAKGITKASSIAFLLESIQNDANIHLDNKKGKWTMEKDCIAFGDGLNDREMLIHCRNAYVMENASSKLKEMLLGDDSPYKGKSELVGPHHAHGVANQLKKLFL